MSELIESTREDFGMAPVEAEIVFGLLQPRRQLAIDFVHDVFTMRPVKHLRLMILVRRQCSDERAEFRQRLHFDRDRGLRIHRAISARSFSSTPTACTNAWNASTSPLSHRRSMSPVLMA